MKKSLIALAVLAASGAAMAQSTVTLYGIADLWVGSVKLETAGVGTRQTLMTDGGVDTSRWGIKGSEDLGGGLKANFNFENGFAMDSGGLSTTNVAFTRQAWVGFSGGFGEVKFGKTGTAYDNVQGRSDAMFDSDLAPANDPGGLGVFRSSNSPAGGKANNNIHYQAPTFGGFTGAVSYALDEKVAGATAITSFNVTYAGGPIGAQVAYQKNDQDGVASDTSFTRLGASYNFGVATAKVMYGKVNNTLQVANADTSEWQIGADFPVSAALTLSASYATSKDDATAAPALGEVKRSGYGLGAAYSLSKRTMFYGGFKKAKDDQGTGPNKDLTVFAVGVNHKF